MEQLEEQIRALQKKIGSNVNAFTLETTNESTTLDSNNNNNRGSPWAVSSNGTFVASATTLGKSDVPLVVAMEW